MRSIELFSGAGGLALGLERAGFESVALIERNRDACATLRTNRPQWNVLEGDIKKVNFMSFADIDIVAGGPPCQPFSMGGKAKGYDDERDMFPEAVRAVRETQPKAFIFENVRGLLRPMFQNYVEFVRLQLTYPNFPISQNASWEINFQRIQKYHNSKKNRDSLAYNVSLHLANAANYGVPQHRHRVFFIGFRNDLDTRWFFPPPTTSEEELLRSKYVTGDYWKLHKLKQPTSLPPKLTNKVAKLRNGELFSTSTTTPWKTVRDAICNLRAPKSEGALPNHVFQPGARSYPGHTGSPFDEPSKALKAGDHGVPGGENMLRHQNGKVRYFSVRESARIQTFPDDWVFHGSWTESMRQLGNAVPVDLGYAVAKSVADHLFPDGSPSNLQPARQTQPRKERC